MKNVIFKRMISLVLCLCMVLSYVPAQVFAAESYGLWVNGVTVTESNAADVLGNSTVSYDAENHVLSLNGANITKATNRDVGRIPCAVLYKGTEPLTISVTGSNSINTINNGVDPMGGAGSYGIYSNADVTLAGTGYLYVQGSTAIGTAGKLYIGTGFDYDEQTLSLHLRANSKLGGSFASATRIYYPLYEKDEDGEEEYDDYYEWRDSEAADFGNEDPSGSSHSMFEIKGTGHGTTYQDNGDDTHTKKCACGVIFNSKEKHSNYTSCSCGIPLATVSESSDPFSDSYRDLHKALEVAAGNTSAQYIHILYSNMLSMPQTMSLTGNATLSGEDRLCVGSSDNSSGKTLVIDGATLTLSSGSVLDLNRNTLSCVNGGRVVDLGVTVWAGVYGTSHAHSSGWKYTDNGDGTHSRSYACSTCKITYYDGSAPAAHSTWKNGACSDCGVSCAHGSYENGFCTACGGYQPAQDTNSDGYYEIDNAGKLYWFAAVVNGGYGSTAKNEGAKAILTANITVNPGKFSAQGYYTDKNGESLLAWTPITNYTGTFNGNNKTISGLYASSDTTNYVGLFGIMNGTVKNLTVADSYFRGKYYVGGIAGNSYKGNSIENCHNSNTVVWGAQFVGGIIGSAYETAVKNCSNSGPVGSTAATLEVYMGGIAGQFTVSTVNSTITLSNCSNSGTVTGQSSNQYIGGILGELSGSVSDCENTGTVTGYNKYVGGITGSISEKDKVTSCSNGGKVSGMTFVGGIVGASDGSISDCGNTATVEGTLEQVGGIAGVLGDKGSISDCSNTGSITMPSFTTAKYAGGIAGISNGTITNCTNSAEISAPNRAGGIAGNSYGAITGCTNTGTVTATNTNGESEAGGIAAFTGTGSISNCSNSGTVTSSGYSGAGGIVGQNGYNGSVNITGCSNSGSISTSGGAAGGIVAWNKAGTISNCHNTANLESSGSVAGIAVDNYGEITGCSNRGNMKATTACGGIAYANFGTVKLSYNAGNIEGYQYGIGGIVGENQKTVTGCYNTGTVTGKSSATNLSWANGVGGIVGATGTTSTSASVTWCHNYGAVTGTSVQSVGAIIGCNAAGSTGNCWYLKGTASVGVGSSTGQTPSGDTTTGTGSATGLTAAQFSSGELWFLLTNSANPTGSTWGQKLGTDPYPVFSSDTVYKVFDCQGAFTGEYSNTQQTAGHNYVDGTCTTCGETCDHAGGINETTGICVDGCGSFVAKVVVWDQMIDDKLHYFEGIDAANQFELSASSTLCMKLLEDVTAQGTSGIFCFAGVSIQLDLNGHTLTLPALQYSDNAVVKVIDTSEGGEGKISTTSHFIKSGAKLTLESGTLDHAVIVQGTLLMDGGTVEGTVTVKENGSLTVNDGIISSANYGIITDSSNAGVTVTGGTISGGGDAYALYNRGNSGNIALSGGVFMGGIWACDNTLADTDTPEYLLKDLLADGYGYAAYDTTNGVGESFAGTDFRSTDNLTVVCVHKNIGYAGDGDLATAYCRNNNCHLPANTVLGTLQVVVEDAVYDGEPHGASVKTTGILENIATRLVYQDVSSGEILNGPPSKVGTYSVTCYSDIYASPSAEYKITEATPVYTWNTPVQTRTYTGKTVEITAPVPTQLEDSDAFGGNFTYSYTGTTAGGESVSGQGLPTNAGEYTVTASAGAWGSYAAAEVPGAMTLTIEKAPLTVTAKALGRSVYGGTAPNHTVSYSDFVIGEDASVLEGALTVFCEYDVTDPEKRNAGEYDIIPGGVTSDNYEIEFKKGILTVEPMEVTLRIDDQTVEYGEFGVMPHQYTFTLQEALPYGETIEDVQPVISVVSDYVQGMAANQTLELKADSFRTDNGNYELTEVLPGELTVTQRKIRAVMTGSATKVYDGTNAVPQNSGLKIELTGTIATDVVSPEATLTYGQKNAGKDITVTAKDIKLIGADAENYQLMNTRVSGAVGEIKKAPLTVKAASEDIFYGGAEPEHSVSYAGFVAGEDKSVLKGKLTLSCDYDTAKAAKRNAGDYAIVPGGLTSDNYEITFMKGTLQVKPLPVTVKIDNKTLTYGDTGAGKYSFTLSQSLPYGETLEAVKASISVSSGYTQGAAAGSVFELRANVFSDGSGNYQLTKVLPGKLTVIPRKVSVSLGGSVTKAYDGTTSVPGTNGLKLTLTNILEDDVVSAAGSFRYGQKTVGEKIAVTAENIKLTGTHAGNYTLTGTTASAKVGKITKAAPVLGKVTAKELVDTTDLSKVILTASNTSVPGTFTVDPGQTLREGENTVSYTFTPKDGVNYQTVTGKVTVTVTKTACDGGKNCPLQQFTDVTSKHWAHHGMDFAVNNGLMKGTGTGKTFEPNTNMSRAMLVTVLWRYSGEPDAPDCSFTDVEADDWFYEAVAWAASEGVVKGMGDGSWFDPNGDVTREMLATILCRYAEMIGVDTSARASLTAFPDEEKVAGWSYNYMKWAVAEGIITGAARDGKTYLDPQVSANRAVVATIMMRFIQSFEN